MQHDTSRVQRPDAGPHRAAAGAARRRGLSAAEERHPEWRPWIRLLRLALGEAAGAPALHGATLGVEERRARAWIAALLDAAAAEARAEDGPLAALDAARVDALALLAAGVTHDRDALGRLAAAAGVDADALGAVAQLAVVPLLAAARRRLAADVSAGWMHGYCPVCGAWPTLAEMRGLERERRLRCGRCAADWRFPVLRCAFCDETEHERLAGLAPDGEGEIHRVDGCHTCGGYLKSVAALGALGEEQLAAEDIATLPLDLAAIERGFGRPEGAAHAAAVHVVPW